MKIIQLLLLYFYTISVLLGINLMVPTILLISTMPFLGGNEFARIEYSLKTLVILFFAFILLSLLWTVSKENTFDLIKSIGSVIIFAFSLRMYIKDQNDLYNILHMFILSGVILLIYLINHGLFNITLTNRIDTSQLSTAEGKFNFNGISQTMIFMCIAFYFLSKRYQNFIYNIAFVIFFITTLALTIISGSKMSIIMFLLTVFFWYYKKGDKKKIGWLSIIMIFLAFVGVIWFSLNNTFLYQIYGYRFESLYLSLFEGTGGTFSDQAREELIRLAYTTFLQHPIIGCGANAFRFISNHSSGIVGGLNYYSHNTYLELLATLGIVGFLLYYAIIFSLYRYVKRNVDRNTASFFYFIILLLLINDFGTVTYYNSLKWMIVVLLYSSVSLIRKEKSKNFAHKLTK